MAGRTYRSFISAPSLVAVGVLLWSAQATAQGIPASCPNDLDTADIIEHDLSFSYCELCGVGTVRIVIENPYRNSDDADFSDIVITENLNISGLANAQATVCSSFPSATLEVATP